MIKIMSAGKLLIIRETTLIESKLLLLVLLGLLSAGNAKGQTHTQEFPENPIGYNGHISDTGTHSADTGTHSTDTGTDTTDAGTHSTDAGTHSTQTTGFSLESVPSFVNWAVRADGTASGGEGVTSMVISPDGSKVYVTGDSEGSGTGPDYLTIAYNAADGSVIWAQRYDGPLSGTFDGDTPAALAISPDGSRIYVTGSSRNSPTGPGQDGLTIAYDSVSGTPIWTRRYLGPASASTGFGSVVVSPDGSTLYISGAVVNGVTNDFLTIACNSSDGSLIWAKRYNGPASSNDGTRSLLLSPDGSRLYVIGESVAAGGPSNFDYLTIAYNATDGSVIWAQRYDGPSALGDQPHAAVLSPGGGTLYITGTSQVSGFLSDYLTLAYNSTTGSPIWTMRYDGPAAADDLPNAIAVSPNGSNVYVTGGSEASGNSSDYLTIAYNSSSGNPIWTSRYNGPFSDRDFANAITVSPDGSEVHVTGSSSIGSDDSDYLTIAYTSFSGSPTATKRYAGPLEDDIANSMAVSSDGSLLYVTGHSVGSVTGFDFLTISYQAKQSIIVTNTNDGGAGSLREAIEFANTRTGTDTIEFGIPGTGPHTIQPGSPLPPITDPVIIDGYTQPGASPNTNLPGLGSNAVLQIEIDGSNAGAGASGLTITAGSSTVRGLVINRFNDTGIHLVTIGGNVIEGNFIGTDPTGTTALANNSGVVADNGGSNNRIGGVASGARNIISGSSLYGVALGSTATGNLVQGNFIGTDVTGASALGNSRGVFLGGGASNNTIGGTTSAERNIISGNNEHGILMTESATTGNLVQGNFIGTDVTGTLAVGNGSDGVGLQDASGNTIGGTTAGAGNVISGNGRYGIIMTALAGAATNNLVQGNFIGTDVNGTAALGNTADGVIITNNALNNTIGGTTAGARNIISGNNNSGVFITGSAATGNQVQGNFIGTDVNGTAALGNAADGVSIANAPNNTIGGTTAGARNVISGNELGVVISGSSATGNLIQGNYIGTDVNGISALGNTNHGVFISNASANTIGGATAAARNVISGNSIFGVILIDDAFDNKIQGNYIGTNAAASQKLPNLIGVHVLGAQNNIIGGRMAGEGNLISGNTNEGILIYGTPASPATGNMVHGNYIGTDQSGSLPLGNETNGIRFDNHAFNNLIGGLETSAGNVIAFNGAFGVALGGIFTPGTGNGVLSNSIHSNGALGIDLNHGNDATPFGVTPNDVGDVDTGTNNLQNFPVLTSVNFSGSTVTIEGTLSSTPNTAFLLQFFANSICDPSGNGEGEIFLGSEAVTTDGSGDAGFTQVFVITSSTGRIISATATDPADNTSEFSKCLAPNVAVPTGFVSEVFAEGLSEPQGLAFDTGGKLIVAASGSGEIFRFDDDGNPELLAFNFDHPIDVAVDANNILYISDFDINGVFTINLNTATFPVSAKPPTSLQTLVSGVDGPTHLELGPSGNLFVSVIRGATNEKVLQVNLAGPTVSDFINFPSGVDHNPQGIAVDANGDMFVALQLLGQVRKAPATATPPIDGGTLPVVLEGLDSPGGIDFGIDGRLFIATRNEVVVSRRNSQSWSTFASGLSGGSFNNLLMKDDGQLFVADFAGGRILRMAVPSQQILISENFPFQINQDGDPSITDGSDLTSIRNAFQNWQNVTTSKFSAIDNGTTSLTNASATDGVNLVTFRDEEFLFPPLVLAVAAKTIVFGADRGIAEIVDADIVFNPAFSNHPTFKFGTDTNPGAFDIESTTTHEVGHVLGLIHSGVLDASMFFVLQPETEGRSLTLDDRAWASQLYPESGFAASFGSISGHIEDGETPGAPIAGALVLATNLTTEDSVHAYSDENGNYLIPGLPAGNYKVLIQPLDGDVGGFPLTPALVSAYLQTITNNTDFQDEFYNGDNESGNPATDNPTEFTSVTVNAGTVTSGINFVTNLDLTPPQITAIFPANGATGVSVTSEVLVTFSEPIEVNTFNNATFTLNNGGASVEGSFLFLDDNQLAVFTPDNPLAFNTAYSIAISTGVTDTRGNALAMAFSSSFTTELPDSQPPTVAQIVPANGASEIFTTSNITVVFSEAVNPNSLTASTPSTPGTGSFTLSSAAGEVFGSLTLELNNTTATFDPEASLAEGTTFTLTLTPAITDLSGNPLASAFTSTFTTVATAAPAIVDFGPADGATGISVNTPILVDFSEPMNVSTFNSNSFKLATGEQQAQGAFEFLNQASRVVFRPSAALSFSATYTVTITTAVQDVSQPPQPLAETFMSSFTTASQPVHPAIISVSPPSAAVGTVVVINGEGFDPIPAKNGVSFNGVSAVVTEATLNSVTTKVPQDATSGPLTVTVNGDVSNAFEFDIVTPAASANDVVANVPAETGTQDAEVTPDGTLAYVTNAGANSVSVIDIVNTILVPPAIQVGNTPLKIAINSQGTLAYVTNFVSNTVSVIDVKPGSPTRNQVIATIPVGINPIGVAVTPYGNRVYVAEFTSKGLSVLDADPNSGAFNHVVARVNTETGNRDVEVSPDGTLAFVTGTAGLTIISINPSAPNFNSVVARVNTETGTRDVEVTPDGGLAIVTTIDGDILIIDVQPGTTFASVVARVNTETGSRDVEVSPDGTLLYATNFEAGTVSVYEFVFAPGATNGAGFDPGGENSPVTTTLIDLKLVDIIPVGDNPEGIVISPKAQFAIVANSGSNNVSIINIGGFATPVEGVEDVTGKIEDLVAAGVLNQGQGNALIIKLDGAQEKLDKGQAKAAINKLQTFIDQVNDFINDGILTPVQGQALINLASAVIDQINNSIAKQDLAGETAPNALPKEYALSQNYPNPFLSGANSSVTGGGIPATTIAFDIPASAEKGVHVELKIYNILGLLVYTLADENKLPGHYTATWTGTHDNGLRAATGIYILRIKAGEFQQVRKMILLQ